MIQPTSRQDTVRDVLPLLFLAVLVCTARLPHASAFTLVSLMLLLAWLFFTRKPLVLRQTDLLFLLFFAYVLSGAVLTKASMSTLLTAAAMTAWFLPPLSHMKQERFGSFYACLGAAVSVLALWEYRTGHGALGYVDSTAASVGGRACAVFLNPNVLALFLLPAVLFAVSACLDSLSIWRRIGYALLALCCLGGLAVTFCRGAWVAAGITLLYLLLAKTHSSRPLMLVLASLPLASLVLPFTVTTRLSSLTVGDSSVRYRLSLWASLLRIPRQHLLFGVGEGRSALLAALSPTAAQGLEAVEHTHSLFLHLSVGHGLFGLALFAFFLFFVFRRASVCIRAVLLSFLLFGLFDDPFYSTQTGVIFWLCASLPAYTPSPSCSESLLCCSDACPVKHPTPSYTPFRRLQTMRPPPHLPKDKV